MVKDSDFVQIHNHTVFSKFDGFSTVKGLVGAAKALGMSHVGITDHGTFAGAIHFLKECRAQEVHAILGIESYLARDHLCHSKSGQPDEMQGNKHINIIAKNRKGYQNVCALSQTASIDGFYYQPRIDFELLSKYREGVIVTSACLSNIINFALSRDKYDEAKQAAGMFQDIFKDDFYLEMMYHGIDKEAFILPMIYKLGKELNIQVIATNDCHYINKEDAEYQKLLMCMSTLRSVKDPKRPGQFPYNEFYFKSAEEMSKMFGHIPRVMRATKELAEKCDYSDIVFIEDNGKMLLPKFDIPTQFKSPLEYLEHLAFNGMKQRGLDDNPERIVRLKQELSDLKLIWDTKRYDFATYFLVVEDIMRFAREKGIGAGIRGSGCGSMLIRCLGLSEVDPVDMKLMWERFLGFDDKYFLSENDFGVEETKTAESKDEDLDTSGVMHERYH